METAITLPGAREPVRSELADFNTPSKLTGGGLGALTQADFLRLLTTQLANQDPLEPVSNEEMLSQMAQFSSLEAETRTTQTLSDIALKLDAMLEAQEAALEAEAAARAAEAEAGEEEFSPFEQASLDTLGLIALQLDALTQIQQETLDAVRDAADEPTEPAALLPATVPIS